MSAKLTLAAFLIFLVGLGLLLFSLLEIIYGLKKSKSQGYAPKKANKWVRAILIVSGLILILVSQSFFWFNSSLKNYFVLNRNIPLAQISFSQSESEKPLLVLQTFDERNRPLLADEVYLDDSAFQIEMEVIKFRRLGNLLGLDELYRFSRVIYIEDYIYSDDQFRTTQLGNEEKSMIGLIKDLKRILPVASTKTILTDPLTLDTSKTVEITYNDLGIIEVMQTGVYSEETQE
ncbi:MAG TPA: hypothetical protein ENO22_00425 [candidate division Zixibacteria bacterium]|nr:hypothetical protein [candidate division Zixibacteria bacterium]